MLGIENGRYKVRVFLETKRSSAWITRVDEFIFFLDVDGDDFEIVGHDYRRAVGNAPM